MLETRDESVAILIKVICCTLLVVFLTLGSFYPMNLHVYTPSSKCYQGEKNDEKYISIIRNYAEKHE